ncbi:NADH-ubiquinone oxidoreductase 10.5 kDa subunit [Phanerochaete sordida]|uniref:NADH-ubiquinone oxidoreductase 10.5 kDa subunit n=1 Tax=Phanerochaete sordida TaxID=48140 RepID=A0A9P3LP21_9APHY|nr:NADH-ubiquinone oxidoreductase 10.5 kDa subunit [Phanerochaete sordida]
MSTSFAKALSPAVREIRILCCQTGAASAGTRHFISSTYPVLKQHNPDLPILIREARDTPARVFARFERGVEKHVDVENLSESDVASRIAQLLNV